MGIVSALCDLWSGPWGIVGSTVGIVDNTITIVDSIKVFVDRSMNIAKVTLRMVHKSKQTVSHWDCEHIFCDGGQIYEGCEHVFVAVRLSNMQEICIYYCKFSKPMKWSSR